MSDAVLTGRQQSALIVLRTLIGWHFLYEGYFKLVLPAWTGGGAPLPTWSSEGYLRAASGPLAPAFRTLAASSWLPAVDVAVAVSLALIGLLLMLGLFTRLACVGAAALLLLFYLSTVPLSGMPQPGAEGTYLLVNKNLIELASVLVLLVFSTGRIAGLDLLRARRVRAVPPAAAPASHT